MRIALESPVVARGGDRFVLRSYSPVTTIGGGIVLDPLPQRKAPWPAGLDAPEPGVRLAALISRRARGISLEEVPLLLGTPPSESEALLPALREVSHIGSRLIAKARTVALREEALRLVRAFHERHPSEPGLSLETVRKSLRAPADVVASVLQGMIRREELVSAEGIMSLPGFVPRLVAGNAVLDRLVARLDQAGLEPPTVEELERETGLSGLLGVLRFGVREGRVTAVESNRFFSSPVLTGFLTIVKELGKERPLTPSAVRDRTGLSRKYLIPLLEYADRAGVTRRVGDARVVIAPGSDSR
jgi:selenocysteine-specific elongation factor